MTPISERDFETHTGTGVRAWRDFKAGAKAVLAALRQAFRMRPDPERLPGRLRRDAGLDELEIERTCAARAPLIR